MALYLLDTNVLAEPLLPRPDRTLFARLEEHGSACVTAAPVLYELRYGCELLEPSRRRAAVERFIEDVVLRLYPVLAYDEIAAAWHARERARLKRTGAPVPFADGVMAAIAATNSLTLVSANLRDFRRVRGLHVESWKS